ncbi:hypothetical protein SMA67_25565 [Escherichia coli]|uniref:hypothetical protein n=1 Tax=Escherichia coli TaxID=562 RepID=UPI003079AEF7
MPAFEWVHVQLHQQKGMISLSPPTICNSAMLWTIIRLIIVVSLVFITGKFGLSREFTFPAAAVGLAFSLFPVLDHIALGYSAKNFYETTNFMGQTVREFGASKITVWWGSIYAKIAYASLAGLIGYGVKVATDD